MVLLVARKELAIVLSDGRIRTLGALLAVMLLMAIGAAVQRFGVISSERDMAQSLVAEQWEQQGEKNPHAAAHYGLYAFRPVGPLTFFDTGVSSHQGVSVWLEAHRRNFAEAPPAADLGSVARFGEMTGAFVLQTLLPLLAILLCYAAFAGERENGTLRQVLATGVRPLQLLSGKALGALGAVMVLLLPVVFLAVLALLFSESAISVLPRVVLLTLAYVVYAGVFVMLSLGVSARASSTQAALVMLVGFWAITSFVVPRIVADAASLLRPLPTLEEFRQGVEQDLQTARDGRSVDEVIRERRQQVLSLYGVASEDELPINFQGMVLALQEEISDVAYARQFSQLQARIHAQLALHDLATLLSPRMAVQRFSAELSETSLDAQQAFEAEAEAYRREFIALLNRDMTFSARGGQVDYRAGAELWSQVESFAYGGRDTSRVAAAAAPGAVLLLLWFAGTALFAALAVRRTDLALR
ncbi:MAG: DUF3526 domain-containing protein [Gammaproteobacteria bacterium]|nr:DUF3526 domain-containing protein [Gammaproteobacteria bacterium]